MNDEELKELLFEGAAEYGVNLSSLQLTAFITYKDMLLDWNTRMNLTGITEGRDVIYKHFVDSLTIAKMVADAKERSDAGEAGQISLIDVGTGAGFPGIPLKIVFPELKVVLLDSLDKRLSFLNAVIDALGLQDIETVHARAEDGAREGAHRECYDIAVARAVAPLSVLIEYCVPFLKSGGLFIAMKGANAQAEAQVATRALDELGAEISATHEFEFAQIGASRVVFEIRKTGFLSRKYPRKAGTPAKKPL